VSPQEYGYYLSFTSQIIWAKLLDRRTHRRRWWAAALVITMSALFLQASRSIFLFCLLALTIVVVARFRSAGGALAVGAVVLGLVVLAGRADVQPASDADSPGPVAVLATHQLSGLTNPDQSTAPIHVDLILGGIEDGIRNPLGLGVSNGTIAQAKERPEDSTSAESDVAATMAALGIPAGIVLLLVVITGVGAAAQLQLAAPSIRHLAWLGILVAGFNQWMSGALYCTSAVLWLCLGGVARETAERLHRRRP